MIIRKGKMDQRTQDIRTSLLLDVSKSMASIDFVKAMVGPDVNDEEIHVFPSGPEENCYFLLKRIVKIKDKNVHKIALATYLDNKLVTVNFKILEGEMPADVPMTTMDVAIISELAEKAILNPGEYFYSDYFDIVVQAIPGSATGHLVR